MMMMTGLCCMMGPSWLNSNSVMNMMWMYGLMMNKVCMVSSLGLFNGMMKISSYEWMIGCMLMMLGGMSQSNSNGSMIVLMMSGMWMTVMSKEWMSMMLSMELQSNGMYLLVCKSSMSSGLSYNMMGGMSSSMMMMSLLSMYSECGLSNIEEMKMFKEYSSEEMGVYGVMLGLLMKMGTAPVHNWMSDVMENMSVEENKWVGGMSKMPLMKMMSEWGGKEMMPMVLTLGMGGMLGSSAYSMKKFMAYSGIHNLGYVLMMSNSEGGWMFFMTQYVITLMSMLMVYKENMTMWSISPYLNNWSVMTMTISMLSSMGMPPLIGFYGKLSMMEWGMENGWGMITVMMMMGSVLSGSNYMSMMKNGVKPRWHQEMLTSSQNGGMWMGVLVSFMVSNMVESYTQCI